MDITISGSQSYQCASFNGDDQSIHLDPQEALRLRLAFSAMASRPFNMRKAEDPEYQRARLQQLDDDYDCARDRCLDLHNNPDGKIIFPGVGLAAQVQRLTDADRLLQKFSDALLIDPDGVQTLNMDVGTDQANNAKYMLKNLDTDRTHMVSIELPKDIVVCDEPIFSYTSLPAAITEENLEAYEAISGASGITPMGVALFIPHYFKGFLDAMGESTCFLSEYTKRYLEPMSFELDLRNTHLPDDPILQERAITFKSINWYAPRETLPMVGEPLVAEMGLASIVTKAGIANLVIGGYVMNGTQTVATMNAHVQLQPLVSVHMARMIAEGVIPREILDSAAA